jgi:hypothetical protein
MDVRNDAAVGNDGRFDETRELGVVPDGELEVARLDAVSFLRLLRVLGLV